MYTEGLKEELFGDIKLGGVSSSSLNYIREVDRRVFLFQSFNQPSEYVYCFSSIGDKSSIS